MSDYNGQAHQDEFVLEVLNFKKNGYFLEIGSNDPIFINNTYLLEKEYNWKGIMVEYDDRFLNKYKVHRPDSIHLIQDATTIDYKSILDQNNFPKNIDYLQIDLEVDNRSTLTTLERLDETVFSDYTFGVVTFEHDIYRGDFFDTRSKSREIFKNRGYVLVFEDVQNEPENGIIYPYEDWYIHPSCVDSDFINKIRDTGKSMIYTEILKNIKNTKINGN